MNSCITLPHIALQTLVGTWHIHKTNFPMWLSGKRTTPSFQYTVGERNGKKGLVDNVNFQKNGKSDSINGFDFPQNESNTKFVWRGNGLLSLIASRWEILRFEDNLAMIYFTKTLFTPAGYDLISRNENITEIHSELAAIWIQELGITGELTDI